MTYNAEYNMTYHTVHTRRKCLTCRTEDQEMNFSYYIHHDVNMTYQTNDLSHLCSWMGGVDEYHLN